MAIRLQSTRLQTNIGQANGRLEQWAINPWRRFSLLIIFLLTGFFGGTAITSIAGVLGQMDPVASLVIVGLCELSVRLRRNWVKKGVLPLAIQLIDCFRLGILYGLFMEAFKLI